MCGFVAGGRRYCCVGVREHILNIVENAFCIYKASLRSCSLFFVECIAQDVDWCVYRVAVSIKCVLLHEHHICKTSPSLSPLPH